MVDPPPPPSAEDQAGALARLRFLDQQMGQFYNNIRALQLALTLAANNGELSSQFRSWAYTQLLQTAVVLEERTPNA